MSNCEKCQKFSNFNKSKKKMLIVSKSKKKCNRQKMSKKLNVKKVNTIKKFKTQKV